MSGETDLRILLREMRAELAPGVYVFATLPAAAVPAGLDARLRFEEAEGVTLILRREEAEARGIEGVFACRMITLTVHSALEAVGFIAHVATRLAAAGMGVNPVAGFYHDHLFVPEDRAEEAMAVLRGIAAEAGAGPP